MKTDDYAEGRAGPKKILSMQQTAMPKVATKQKPYYKVDGLRSDGYEDGQKCQGSYYAKEKP